MACEYLAGAKSGELLLSDVRKEQTEFKHICRKNNDTVGYTSTVGYIKDEDYNTYCSKDENYKNCRVFKGEVDTDGNPIFL